MRSRQDCSPGPKAPASFSSASGKRSVFWEFDSRPNLRNESEGPTRSARTRRIRSYSRKTCSSHESGAGSMPASTMARFSVSVPLSDRAGIGAGTVAGLSCRSTEDGRMECCVSVLDSQSRQHVLDLPKAVLAHRSPTSSLLSSIRVWVQGHGQGTNAVAVTWSVRQRMMARFWIGKDSIVVT